MPIRAETSVWDWCSGATYGGNDFEIDISFQTEQRKCLMMHAQVTMRASFCNSVTDQSSGIAKTTATVFLVNHIKLFAPGNPVAKRLALPWHLVANVSAQYTLRESVVKLCPLSNHVNQGSRSSLVRLPNQAYKTSKWCAAAAVAMHVAPDLRAPESLP